MNWYLKVLKQYFDFSGRARRKEYWMFVLFNYLIIILLTVLIFISSETFSNSSEVDTPSLFLLSILGLYTLFTIIPYLAVAVRRLHDINKSGVYWFVQFIPIAGPIWFLVLICTEGEAKSNKWGNNPKGVGNDNMINQIGKE